MRLAVSSRLKRVYGSCRPVSSKQIPQAIPSRRGPASIVCGIRGGSLLQAIIHLSQQRALLLLGPFTLRHEEYAQGRCDQTLERTEPEMRHAHQLNRISDRKRLNQNGDICESEVSYRQIE